MFESSNLKLNTGYLVRNEQKRRASDAEYVGQIDVLGNVFALSAWVREKNGKKYFRLAAAPRNHPAEREVLVVPDEEPASSSDSTTHSDTAGGAPADEPVRAIKAGTLVAEILIIVEQLWPENQEFAAAWARLSSAYGVADLVDLTVSQARTLLHGLQQQLEQRQQSEEPEGAKHGG